MEKYNKIKLENQICFPLYALSREVIKLYKPILKKYDLTYTQYVTMLAIWEVEKINFKELCETLYLDSGTLTPVINKLVSRGLIIKYRSKEDDRLVIIELTKKGELLKEDIIEVPEQMLCNFNGDIEDIMVLKKYLRKFLTLSKKK